MASKTTVPARRPRISSGNGIIVFASGWRKRALALRELLSSAYSLDSIGTAGKTLSKHASQRTMTLSFHLSLPFPGVPLRCPSRTLRFFRQIAIPNTVSQEWEPQDIVKFTHACDWDSTATLSSTCPNGTDITTVCTGTATVRPLPGMGQRGLHAWRSE